MKKWVCPVCGYVHEGDVPPEKCPQCGVPGAKFTEQKGEMSWAAEHVVGVAAGVDAEILEGLRANREKMGEYLDRSLMLVTCLTPRIGYEKAAQAALLAHREGISLREAVLRAGLLTEAEYGALVDPEKMV